MPRFLPVLPLLFALVTVSCAPRPARVEALASAGWLGEACDATLLMMKRPQALLDAHLAGGPRLIGEVALPAAFPRAPAYGTDVLIARLVVDEKAAVAPQRSVSVGMRVGDLAFAQCDDCSETWLATSLGYPPPTPATRGSPLKGLLGMLALGGALLLDTVMAPVHALGALSDSGPPVPWFTGAASSYLASASGTPGSSSQAIDLLNHGPCLGDAPCVETWIGRRNPDSSLPDGMLDVTWRWQHDGCVVAATWDIPLAPGTDAIDRLGRTFAQPIVLDGPPVQWGVHGD